jgi:NlpC/P60 family
LEKLFYLLIVLFSLTSCSSLKKSSSPAPPAASASKELRFIENISITPGKQSISSTEQNSHQAVHTASGIKNPADNLSIESVTALQIKYAILLNLPIETSLNRRVLEFMEEWYGTPYRYGGTSKKGVDCSAFVNFFMSAVYGLTVPRNSKEQYSATKKIKKKELEEGDLVFFNTRGGVSHVGVYIANNKFAHASTSSGVIISDLDDDYFSRRYVGSGRVR